MKQITNDVYICNHILLIKEDKEPSQLSMEEIWPLQTQSKSRPHPSRYQKVREEILAPVHFNSMLLYLT
jgi:hypothetical protein